MYVCGGVGIILLIFSHTICRFVSKHIQYSEGSDFSSEEYKPH